MPVLIFHLKDVPDDEAADVRQILERAQIDFYETSGGTVALALGLASPAIWIKQEADRDRARALIDAYQLERRALSGQEPTETVGERVRNRPLPILMALSLIGIVLYFTLSPFFF